MSVAADGTEGDRSSWAYATAISADGRYVVFYSWASNLVDGDDADTVDWFRAENPLWVAP